MDVTNKQEFEIRRTKANLDALINCIQDMIWSVDTNMHLITANRAFKEMVKGFIGETVKEGDTVLAKKFGDDHLNKWKDYYERALKGEHLTVNNQHHNPITQSIRYSAISINPMVNEDDVIFGVACFSKDITQSILNIQELQQHEQRIIQQNKQLTEIAQINAHEIRRPVASILGLMQLVKETGEADQKVLQHLETTAQELDAVIKRIIDKTS